LSRFAFVRTADRQLHLECPLSHGRILLHDHRAAALIQPLAEGVSARQAAKRIGVCSDVAAGVMTLLLHADMLTETDASGKSLEDDDPALRLWEFHDLLFHSRSRIGRHDQEVGATYRFAGALDPPPALRPACRREAVPLERPDLDRCIRADPPLGVVQETRRSIREYDTQPIKVSQLGEFLYRVGRVKHRYEAEVETPFQPVRMDFALRPYPAGGALYELELFVVVNSCEGLPAGLYAYVPEEHCLDVVSDRSAAVDGLLLGASRAAGIRPETVQVLVLVAARFQRIAWKYASMAYAATLKHVGVLLQTMYLVATAMELAPCAIGCGDSDLFARAAATNYYAEGSVGEFLLGSTRSGAGR
jgi:SagB-type dehydrogenase family enzyme